jgi:MFS transporter, SHS family, lactate transporter
MSIHIQVSAASAQIEATIGEHYPVHNADGTLKHDATGATVPDYGLTQAIFMGCVFAGVIITSMYWAAGLSFLAS